MRTFTVIIHDLPQARAAIDAAAAAQVRVELRSPPGGATTLGPGVFKAMDIALNRDGTAPDTPLILDCGNDAGLAMAAIRHGCRHIGIDAAETITAKLRGLAASADVCVHGPAAQVLDLGADPMLTGSSESLSASFGAYFNGGPPNA